MLSISVSCISSCREKGANLNNLIFAGQILPESNGGLEGTPSLIHRDKNESLIAGVFDGSGESGERSAYYAANAFRNSLDQLSQLNAPEALLEEIVNRLNAAHAPGLSSAAVCVRDHTLVLGDLGTCRAYLMRDRKLYRLSSDNGSPSGKIHRVSGALHAGDRLLLCVAALDSILAPEEILGCLASTNNPDEALIALLSMIRARTVSESVTAVLLHVNA